MAAELTEPYSILYCAIFSHRFLSLLYRVLQGRAPSVRPRNAPQATPDPCLHYVPYESELKGPVELSR